MSNFYNSHTLEELDEMHPCERHNMVGSLDLGCCGLCYGTGWMDVMFSNAVPCPNTEQNEQAYQEWRKKRVLELEQQQKQIYGFIETAFDEDEEQVFDFIDEKIDFG